MHGLNMNEEQFFNYAYLPGKENDGEVQKTLKTMKHIFSLAELIEKFELALRPYIQARSKFETTMTNLKGIVNTLAWHKQLRQGMHLIGSAGSAYLQSPIKQGDMIGIHFNTETVSFPENSLICIST